jgi:hypothetical protein
LWFETSSTFVRREKFSFYTKKILKKEPKDKLYAYSIGLMKDGTFDKQLRIFSKR